MYTEVIYTAAESGGNAGGVGIAIAAVCVICWLCKK